MLTAINLFDYNILNEMYSQIVYLRNYLCIGTHAVYHYSVQIDKKITRKKYLSINNYYATNTTLKLIIIVHITFKFKKLNVSIIHNSLDIIILSKKICNKSLTSI